MADFHQPRFVPTVHALGRGCSSLLAARVRARAEMLGRSTTVVLPALAIELEGQALPRIVQQLARMAVPDRVILVLGHATPSQRAAADALLEPLGSRASLICLDDERLPGILSRLKREGLEVVPQGKGYACWVGICAALASEGSDVIALHDCDIETYDSALVPRLVAPLVLPEEPADFAKGYYPRATARLNGRVTRLLVAPLLRALESLALPTSLPAFLAEFRYPLAGEVAFSRDLLSELPLQAGWALEVGALAEIHRRQDRFSLCQVDIADEYEHRHRRIEPSNTQDDSDLSSMVEQILGSVLHALRRERIRVDASVLRPAAMRFRQEARRLMAAYEADAVVNGLPYDRRTEARTVEAFSSIVDRVAAAGGCVAPVELPSWREVTRAAKDVVDTFAALGRTPVPAAVVA